jgi:hypothetical protein
MEPNFEKAFNLELPEAPPQGSHLEWYVDGVLKQTGNDFSIRVSFPDEGEHIIICRIVDSTGHYFDVVLKIRARESTL